MKVKSKVTGDVLEAVWVWGHWYFVIYIDEPYMYNKEDFYKCFEVINE